MDATHAFDGDDLPGADAQCGFGDGVVCRYGLPAFIVQTQTRAARRAGIGLGMETARGGVVVFGPACQALHELCHAGVGAVIGESGGDRVARATVDAVDEGVAVAAVGGIEQFRQAVRADRRVGRDAGLYLARLARRDAEAAQAGGRSRQVARDFFHARQCGRFALQAFDQAHHLRMLAFDSDLHAFH
jgi:hypothetical protein